MIDITGKKFVTTRKVHTCFACTDIIHKGDQAVYVTGKQDEQNMRMHLHPYCNMRLAKHKRDLPDGIYYNCLNDIPVAPQWLQEAWK